MTWWYKYDIVQSFNLNFGSNNRGKKKYNIKKANNSKFGFCTLFLKYRHVITLMYLLENDFIFEYESNI